MSALLHSATAPLRTPTWLACATLLLAHQILQYVLHVDLAFVDGYLDPVLAMPILLGLGQAERRVVAHWCESRPDLSQHVLWRHFVGWRSYTWPEVVGQAVGLAVFFEVGFPLLDARFVCDVWDLPAYVLGTLLAWFGVNRAADRSGDRTRGRTFGRSPVTLLAAAAPSARV